MARRHWRVTALVALAFGASTTARAQSADAAATQELVVHVYDYVRVPADVLQHAKTEAARVYHTIGVSVTWVDERTEFDAADPRPNVAVAIISEPATGRATVTSDAMGSAPGTVETRGHLAYIFYDRITFASKAEPYFLGRLLGLVIAHETGHLLLPYGSHSESGIMRGSWNMRRLPFTADSQLTFTDEQAELIRGKFATTAADHAVVADADRR
jgi:hypothetical protein